MKILKNRFRSSGITLIEIIVAMAIFMIIVPGMIMMVLGSHTGTLRSEKRLEANALAQQGIEAARAIRNYDWDELAPGTHGLDKSNGYWELSGTQDVIWGKYTRSLEVQELNPTTKSITVNISWNVTPQTTNHLRLTNYVTQWESSAWKESTVTDFEAGRFNSVTVQNNLGGEVGLERERDMQNLEYLTHVNFPGSADIQGSLIVNNRLFLATTGESMFGEFIVLDISNISQGEIEVLGDVDLGSTANGIAVKGDYAYIATSDTNGEVKIVRLSDFTLVNSIDLAGSARALNIEIVDDTAYITTWEEWSGYWDSELSQWITYDEFLAYDISDPEGTPSLLGGVKFSAIVSDLAIRDGYAFVSTNEPSAEVQVVRLSDYTIIEKLNLPSNAYANALKMEGDYIYVGRAGAGSEELVKISIADPYDLQIIEGVNLMHYGVEDIDIRDGRAYLAMSNWGEQEVTVVDLDTMTIEQHLDLFGYYNSRAISARGNFVYPTSYYDADTLQVWQGRDEGWYSPNFLSPYDLPGEADALDVVIEGDYAYIGTEENSGGNPEFYIFQIADPQNPILLGQYDIDGDVNKIFAQDSFAYLATNRTHHQLMILDISNKTSPTLAGNYGNSNARPSFSVFVLDDVAYVGTRRQNGNHREFLVLDISDKSDIQLLSEEEINGDVLEIVVRDGYAFIGSNNNGNELRVIDVQNPSNAQTVSWWGLSGSDRAYSGFLYEDYWFIGSQNNPTLLVIDASDPTSLSWAGEANVGPIRDLHIEGDFAFIASTENNKNFKILDISDLSSITEVFSTHLPLSTADAYGIFMQEDFVFLASDDDAGEFLIYGKGNAEDFPYSKWGIFTSQAFDSENNNTSYQNISWTQGGSGDIKCQIRTASTQNGLENALWVGADGSPLSYYENPDVPIITYPQASGKRWIQYRCILEGDGVTTPLLEDITLQYS